MNQKDEAQNEDSTLFCSTLLLLYFALHRQQISQFLEVNNLDIASVVVVKKTTQTHPSILVNSKEVQQGCKCSLALRMRCSSATSCVNSTPSTAAHFPAFFAHLEHTRSRIHHLFLRGSSHQGFICGLRIKSSSHL